MTRVLPVLPTFAPGPLSSANLNTLANAIAFAMNVPSFRMYQTVAQSVPNINWTQITCDTLDYDSDNGRSGVSPYTYTIPSNFTGRWTFSCAVSWSGNATGIRGAAIYVNGAQAVGAFWAAQTGPGGNVTSIGGATTIHVNAGDQIALYAEQTSGGALSTFTGSNLDTYFEGRLASQGNP